MVAVLSLIALGAFAYFYSSMGGKVTKEEKAQGKNLIHGDEDSK